MTPPLPVLRLFCSYKLGGSNEMVKHGVSYVQAST